MDNSLNKKVGQGTINLFKQERQKIILCFE